MLEAIEGSQAIARAVAMCRPDVVAAYPITPQTHIVEALSRLVAEGEMHTEFVSVESEFSAASVVLGAAATGARAYTATASQGVLLMAEVLFNISGMRVPLVMTVANRAVSAPLSIWNDHSDSMAVRDCGWIQLHCADNQEAVDTTIQAFRISQETELPVMVCMDGFVLTHTLEPIEMPDQTDIDGWLPPLEFDRRLDPSDPKSLGTLVSPDFFAEVRHSHHAAMIRALDVIETVDDDWHAMTGRRGGGLVEVAGDPEAKIGILAMGSTFGTLETGMEHAGAQAGRARLIKLRAFRPFPAAALRAACAGLEHLIVIDRAISPGLGGVVGTEVAAVLAGAPDAPRIHNHALGLGGRDIPETIYADLMTAVADPDGPAFSVFDADLTKLDPEDR
ncbi:pyruvate ferredoxin oxidoreductase [Ponticoccus sp. SC2-23]|uniref:pyruvate ferredoxin oxidoreductase n=1 Tax=Alexandriicola marinus TaxID=2081710 RepID=UPI000FD89F57|nr:pyruvate ferredoxin oxidoreductase [Alexandriicola marinus]MBM1218740.1 pyruvate ferredoxin oxidoreductase [Ponticoccus sp. SC6-9]MBM1224188.1 pyruvate ferredoxin oxidoreductase [Ponticoccus sp. SC6-15]MBM1230033.1 pyruvate ferredoxin oxidoreductase [Ponticoccus sp. SC6-38]MBM1233154.1 pyruvate ferredoxin oxidoreductase [Ponticoccus sp. SC6-45]MBM1236896.1 pyruvate ferredoxin oxidoreductase [Ponticoccus sp. SC6-49]MBM1242165.1 pyruvate ferredoxin oxidoreductase [Ponticoccus sp. SC2-64]MBM